MRKLNLFLGLFALILFFYSFWQNGDMEVKKIRDLLYADSEGFHFATVEALAEELYKKPYVPIPKVPLPGLDGISYEEYRQILFKPDVAIWKNLGLPYQLHFFHPGHIYSGGIKIHEIVDGVAKEIPYDASRFSFGNLKLPEDFSEKAKNVHYTGFRIHYPINNPNALEEFAVFQGASYFRIISKNQVYGLSNRGIAINTGLPQAEEFPVFESFFIKRPNPSDTEIIVYALLNSESVVGAYELRIEPGDISKVHVHAKVKFRKRVKRLGLAPITSMYLYGESDPPIRGNIHPEVHDSDGLLLQTKEGDWEWRPLLNPKTTQVTQIPIQSLRGFGFIQRDRKFKSYQDQLMKYHLRPSSWVEPNGDWGEGKLTLLEIATELDSDDNMGVFWEPKTLPLPGASLDFSYTITYPDKSPNSHTLEKASAFYRGKDPLFPKENQITLYFTGNRLRELSQDQIPQVVVENSVWRPEQIRTKMEKIPELNQWRLNLFYPLEPALSEWKVYLKEGNTKISETWIYRDGISK